MSLSGIWSRAGRAPAVLFAGAVLALIPQALRAQIPGNAVDQAQGCSGPLASLMPECQAGKGVPDPPANRPARSYERVVRGPGSASWAQSAIDDETLQSSIKKIE